MKTFLAVPPLWQEKLEEKEIEERIKRHVKTEIVCGRFGMVDAFEQIYQADAVVVCYERGKPIPKFLFQVFKISVALKKRLYTLVDNDITEIKEVHFAHST